MFMGTPHSISRLATPGKRALPQHQRPDENGLTLVFWFNARAAPKIAHFNTETPRRA